MVTPRQVPVSGQIPAFLLGRSNSVNLDQAVVFSSLTAAALPTIAFSAWPVPSSAKKEW